MNRRGNVRPTKRTGWFRRMNLGLAALFLGLTSTLVTSPHAEAAAAYDGKSPVSTGCMNGAYPAWQGSVWRGGYGEIGWVQVMYSPSCKTNWVRSKSYIGSVRQSKEITRYLSPQNHWGYFREKEVDNYAGWTYSMMVYAPGSTPVSFSVVFTQGSIAGSRSGQLTS